MSEKAKPCPFCKSERLFIPVPHDINTWVVCLKCRAEGPMKNSGIDALEAWNTRAVTGLAEAQAQIAARDAKILWLLEVLRLLLADWEDCMGRERPSIGSNAAREALKGGAA